MSLILLAAATLASSIVEDCGAALSAQWKGAEAAHPIDPAKHVPVITLINVPEIRYQDAVRDLTHEFRTFKESPGSGIVAGACCGFPLYGSISFDELVNLPKKGFIPLCEVGLRSGAKMVQVRMEYREPYEKGGGAAPYFWISH